MKKLWKRNRTRKKRIWKKVGSWSFNFFFLFLFLFSPLFCRGAASDVLITEVMYNPDGTDDKHEWLEIKNSGTSEVTIIIGAGADSWRFFDGNNHTFVLYQGSNILGAGAYAILADDPATFLNDYPDFNGAIFKVSMSLKNSGDIIKLSNNEGSTWFSETQYISFFGANGNGKTLEYTNQGWRESFVDGGTPGKENSVVDDAPKPKEYSNKVYISKIYPHPKTGESEKEFIELYNNSPNDIDLAGWKLDDEPNAGSSEYTIAGKIIKAHDSLVFYKLETKISLNDTSGDIVRLLDPNDREISQTPNYGKAKSEKKFYRDAKGVWRWEEEIVGKVIEISTTTTATTPLRSSSFAGQAVATTTEITITAPPVIEGKIKGAETIKKENPLLRKIAYYVLDASIFLLLLLLGDYLWKLEQKAQKKPKN